MFACDAALMLKQRRYILLAAIIVCSLIVQCVLFATLLMRNGPEAFRLGDTVGYSQIALNVLDGNGYSLATSSPYAPDSIRTPGYPLVLFASAWAFDSFVPVIIFQILLGLILIVLTYQLCFLISNNVRLSLIAAGLIAFEPYSAFVHMSLITESLFAVLLVAGVYAMCLFVSNARVRDLILASVLFGGAAFVRPIGQFLPILLLGIVLLKVPRRDWVRYALLAVIPFLVVTGPWLIRNYNTFGVLAMSSGGLQNAYSDLGAAVIASRDNIPWYVAHRQLEIDFAERHNISVDTIQQNLSLAPTLFKESLLIFKDNPVDTVKVISGIAFAFFTHDAWIFYPQYWGFIPRFSSPSFSPTLVLLAEGPIVAVQKVVESAGGLLVIPVAGRLFWLTVNVAFFAGILLMLRKGGNERKYGLILLFTVLYLFILSGTVGFGVNARFRYPVNALFFTSAVVGGSLIARALRSRLVRQK